MTNIELRQWLAEHRHLLTSPPPRLDVSATPTPKIEFKRLLPSQYNDAISRSDKHVS